MAHTQDHTPPRVIHYAPRDLFAPGDRPLCGNESSTAIYSDDPRQGWGGRLRASWPNSGTRALTRFKSSPAGQPGQRGPGSRCFGLSSSLVCKALWFLDP